MWGIILYRGRGGGGGGGIHTKSEVIIPFWFEAKIEKNYKSYQEKSIL